MSLYFLLILPKEFIVDDTTCVLIFQPVPTLLIVMACLCEKKFAVQTFGDMHEPIWCPKYGMVILSLLDFVNRATVMAQASSVRPSVNPSFSETAAWIQAKFCG